MIEPLIHLVQSSPVRVTRFVSDAEEHSCLGRDVYPGEVFYAFGHPTYGCVDDYYGIALTERSDGDYPFFEFPRDALEQVNHDG